MTRLLVPVLALAAGVLGVRSWIGADTNAGTARVPTAVVSQPESAGQATAPTTFDSNNAWEHLV
jgi:hypothetical protein